MSWLKNVFDVLKPGTRKLVATLFICILAFIIDVIQLVMGLPISFDASFFTWVIGWFSGANVAETVLNKVKVVPDTGEKNGKR